MDSEPPTKRVCRKAPAFRDKTDDDAEMVENTGLEDTEKKCGRNTIEPSKLKVEKFEILKDEQFRPINFPNANS